MKKHVIAQMLFAVAVFPAILNAERHTDPVVMNIAGEDVRLSEFQYLYNKNAEQQAEPVSLDEYVKMFVNYKLKVREAQDARLDTVSTFVNEYRQFRTELAAPYLRDAAVDDSLARVSYSHMCEDVAVRHLMLPYSDRTLMNSIRDSIIAGADFAEMVRRHSPDKTAVATGGYMGYISAGRIPVYAIEDAAYRLPVGGVSEVIQSKWGLHIIKVENRRDDPGEVKARHILKLTYGLDADAAAAKKASIDSIYTVLKNGADFIKVASAETEDPSGKKNGGDLPWFGSGMMVPDFENAAFALSDGEISKPVKSPYGYHIILCEGHRPVASFDEVKGKLLEAIASDERSQIAVNRALDRYIAASRGKIGQENIASVYALIESCGGINGNTRTKLAQMIKPIFEIGSKPEVATCADLVPMLANVETSDLAESKAIAGDCVRELIYAKASEHFITTLPDREPAYANLLNEYRDGLLLCEISNEKVWEKANSDHDGLQKCFLSHRGEFTWDKPHYKGYVVAAKSDSLADAACFFLSSANPEEAQLVTELRKQFGTDVKIEKVIAGKGDNSVVDYVAFGAPVPSATGRWIAFRAYSGRVIEQPEEASDVRGAVSLKYQQELEQKWLEELAARYPVKINEGVIDKLR